MSMAKLQSWMGHFGWGMSWFGFMKKCQNDIWDHETWQGKDRTTRMMRDVKDVDGEWWKYNGGWQGMVRITMAIPRWNLIIYIYIFFQVTRDGNGIRRMLGSSVFWGHRGCQEMHQRCWVARIYLGQQGMIWEGCHVEKTHLKALFQATRASRKTMRVDKGTRKDGI